MFFNLLNSKFIKNYFWIACAEIASKWINIFLPVVIANFYWLEIFGIYSFALSLWILFLVFSDLGLTQLFIREVAKNKDQKNTEKLFILFFRLKLILSIICIVWLLIFYLIFPSLPVALIAILSCVYIVNSFIEFIRWIYRWREKSLWEAIIRLVYSITIIWVLCPVILYAKISILEFSLLFLLLHVIFLWSLLIYIFKYTIKPTSFQKSEINFRLFRNSITTSYPFAISALVVMLYYYIDTIILKLFVNYEEIWIYSAAYRIVLIFIAPISISVHALFPVFSRLFVVDRNTLSRLIKKISCIIFIISILFVPILVIFSLNIANIIYGELLNWNILVLQILLSSLFFLYLWGIYGTAIQSSERQKLYMKVSICGLMLNILGNFLFIPYYGITGAAISTLLTEILVSGWYYYNYHRIHKV